MKVVLLLLLAGIIKFGRADHVVVIGTGPPPATVGPGIPITPFFPDPRLRFEFVNKVPSGFLSGEELTLNPICIHLRVGQGWGDVNSWSHGYTGDVYRTDGNVYIGLPYSTSAFVFYIMANVKDIEFKLTVAFVGGQIVTATLLTNSADSGKDDAVGFAVFMHDEFGPPTGVTITNYGAKMGVIIPPVSPLESFTLVWILPLWHCVSLLSLLRQSPTAQHTTLISMLDHMIQTAIVLHSFSYLQPLILLEKL